MKLICRCTPFTPTPAWRTRYPDELLAWAYRQLDCRATNYLSRAVVELEFEHKARITTMAVDQWFGVAAETFDGEFKVYVECDALEDGIAYILRRFQKRKEALMTNTM